MTRHNIHDLTNATAYDSKGDKLGSVKEVYINDTTGQPDFAEVGHGLFGLQSSIVPLRGHTLQGDHLTLAFPKDLIKDAPDIKHDEHLSEEDHAVIYRHFGLEQVTDVHTYGQEGLDRSGERFDTDLREGGLAERERNLSGPQGSLHEDPLRGGTPAPGVSSDRQRAESDRELGLDRTPEDRAMRGTSAHGMSDEPREFDRDLRDADRLPGDQTRDQRTNLGHEGPVDADGRPLDEGDRNYPRSEY